MPLNDPAKETFEELRTKEYRLFASVLSSAETTKARASLKQSSLEALDLLPSERVAQNLLSHHPGWMPKTKRLVVAGDPDESSSKPAVASQRNNDLDIYIPCCPHCGDPLQPGSSGTTIRLKRVRKKSRAQRRRFSRRVAAEKKQLQKAYGTAKPPSELAKFVATNFDTTIQQHGKCRNVICLHCPCGGTTVLEGFPIRRSTKQPDNTQQKQQVIQTKEPAKTFDPTKDFVSVSIERGGKKKIERKKIPTGPRNRKKLDSKNQLMNFLSSLNDH